MAEEYPNDVHTKIYIYALKGRLPTVVNAKKMVKAEATTNEVDSNKKHEKWGLSL